ncbi:MAG TPA: L-histidine N(alpha)-methyltransferase [Gammaproteobacteria bacterium]|nr:L-histidine N(alpha)-methyltransferase [Gammaproteobacteria bacterium]
MPYGLRRIYAPRWRSVQTHACPRVAFHDCEPALGDFTHDVVAGLSRPQKVLPPKYFYDQRGSLLFEQICGLEEYYLTRTEIGLLERHAREIGVLLGGGCVLIEYGSGSSNKVRYLLNVMHGRVSYIAIDISRAHLLQSTAALAEIYPQVNVAAVCADFMQPFSLPAEFSPRGRRVGFFPGSSIGNFGPRDGMRYLRAVAATLGEGGILLIGVDLKKEKRLLDAAYNDRGGITAAFNLNLLARINRELAADFRLDGFRHHAFYDESRGRVEMHLISWFDQTVTVGGARFNFRAGETIHTENSYKYSIAEFHRLAARCGYIPVRVWTDERRLFSIHALVVRNATDGMNL